MDATAPSPVAAPSGTTSSLRLDLRGHVTEVTRARATVAEWAARDLAPDRSIDDLLLIVTELVANAVEACRSRVRLTVTADGARVIVEVEDDGPGIAPATPPRARPSRWHTHGTRGRGLQLVDALAEQLSFASSPRGATVRAIVTTTLAPREAR